MAIGQETVGWLKGEIIKKERVVGKVEESSYWVDLPKELNEHMGSPHRLRILPKIVKEAEKSLLKLTYLVQAQANSKNKVIFKKSYKLDESQIIKEISFIKLFQNEMWPRPGILKVELIENLKVIKSESISVRGME